MGDRAVVVFKTDDNDVSPAVYLHWNGSDVADWLKELATLMGDRKDDVGYAAARFCGICHSHISGELGLGLLDDGRSFVADPKGTSHGDQGVFIVNCKDYSFEQIK